MLSVHAYREDLAYIHDAGHGAIASDAAERLITELAVAPHPGGTVVDLGCGSGILAGALVRAGYQVVGIDMSDAMVALARARAPNAEFHVGSFVSTDLPTSVAVTAIGEVVNYTFDPANGEPALTDLVRRAYEALVPGGVFLFDVAGPDRAQSNLSESHRTHATGRDWAVFVETAIEPGGVLTRHITSFRQVGDLYRRADEVHRLVLLETEAVLDLLRVAGFEAEILAKYRLVQLPRGVVAFLGRKPVPRAV
jgi:SAM-dependent methyltransferase